MRDLRDLHRYIYIYIIRPQVATEEEARCCRRAALDHDGSDDDARTGRGRDEPSETVALGGGGGGGGGGTATAAARIRPGRAVPGRTG
jgi:hypothetical protein